MRRDADDQMPTEGTFRIREYVPGDDARRIHWVRSLQQDQLDRPAARTRFRPANPTVRLVLDNELFGTETLTCRAPDEMLDALVRVWLGIAKALAATRHARHAGHRRGRRRRDERVARAVPRALERRRASRFGARIGWQGDLPLERSSASAPSSRSIVSAGHAASRAARSGWVGRAGARVDHARAADCRSVADAQAAVSDRLRREPARPRARASARAIETLGRTARCSAR